jgi:hypothetical protein
MAALVKDAHARRAGEFCGASGVSVSASGWPGDTVRWPELAPEASGGTLHDQDMVIGFQFILLAWKDLIQGHIYYIAQ